MPTSTKTGLNRPSGKELAFQKKKAQNAAAKHREEPEEEESDSEEEASFFNQEDAQRNDYDRSDGEEESFLPVKARQSHSQYTSSQSSRSSSSSKASKKKKPRRSRSDSEAEEQEGNRRPLSDAVHQNRKIQRYKAHHNMPSGRGRGSKNSQGRRADSRGAAKDQQPAPQEQEASKENAQLREQLHRMQQRLKLQRTGGSKKVKTGSQSAMEREVDKTSKQKLWKVCKFIRNETKLAKATKYVMEQLHLQEMEGLQGKELVEAQENWKATYSSQVRKAMNRQRNYVQQELREAMEEAFRNNQEAEFPNQEEIMDIVMRRKLTPEDAGSEEEAKRYQIMFDNYWNVLLPKMAGHFYWGPTKRHYGLISFALEDDEDVTSDLLVTASDEAMVATMWVNCYKKWWYREQCIRAKIDLDPKHEDMKTPFSDSKGGQKKFGGWNRDAVIHYSELEAAIQKNRKEMENLEDLEREALERIRKAEKVAEKDAKRKTKKRKSSLMDDDDEDSDDDEDDYDAW